MSADATKTGPSTPAAIAALTVIGLAFHLPRLFRPLSDIDACAGPFFGVFFQYYDTFGFAELRGLPLWQQIMVVPQAGTPYLTHPPGLWWTMYALGGAEWSMRLPTIVCAILAACCLFALLRARLGGWPALIAGVLVMGTPAMAVYCQLSYEPVSTGIGLFMWIATLRAMNTHGPNKTRWRLAQFAAAFIGTWMDWSFGMYCFGLVPLAISSSLRQSIARLGPPAAGTMIATALVVIWQRWALAGVFDPVPEGSGMLQIVDETILTRPALGDFIPALGHWFRHTMGLPLLAAAIPGMFVLGRRAPRAALALLVAGASHWLLFANHALNHPHFYCLTAPFVAASGAALWALLRSRAPRVGVFVIATVVAATWMITSTHDQRTNSTFQRDVGETLTQAAIARDADGNPTDEEIFVLTNFAPIWGAYVTIPQVYVIPPRTDITFLETVRQQRHVRYLHLIVDKPDGVPWNDREPALEAWLGQFEKTRIEKLEYHIFDPGYGWDWDITEAWLVDIPRKR